jgi:purine-cytosine permease-like protein
MLVDLKSFATEKTHKNFLTQSNNSITMGPMVTSKKWLFSGIFWLTEMVVSIILLTALYGQDSINIYQSFLALIPTTFQFLLAVSFIMYFLERRNEKIKATTKSDA